ncbi:MAG: ATP-binding protein [Planctomycetota bacterium]
MSSSRSPSKASASRSSPSGPAALAHELNNLLAGSMQTVASAAHALNRADAVNESADPRADVLRRLDSAEQLLRRMADLVETLGQASAATAATPSVPASTRTQTLGEAIDEALSGIEAEAASKSVTLDAMVDPRLAALPADALYTVVSNGLRNALDAIASRCEPPPRKADRIDLRLERDDTDIVLTIVDSGTGIDGSLQTPGGGFRFGVTTKPNGHGIGLGLCRQVALALNGKLWLRNGLPSGAVLTLRFPVASLASQRKRGAA